MLLSSKFVQILSFFRFVILGTYRMIFRLFHVMSNSRTSPLKGYEGYPPLLTTTYRSGKGLALDPLPPSYTSLQVPSSSYTSFPAPITSDFTTGGFDAHICFDVGSSKDISYAKQLHSRIRYEFPELRTYQLFDHPAGPFVTGSFEVSLRTPLQLGAFVAWLIVYRGPLSVLVHSNTEGTWEDDAQASADDHTIRAFWLGDSKELDLGFFKRQRRK
jgi:aromatic ring-cleaving dioxygenase